MKTIQHNGWTELQCSHVEAGGAGTNSIEIEPCVLFRCCGFCAAFIRQNALLSLIEQGVKVELTPVRPPAPKEQS